MPNTTTLEDVWSLFKENDRMFKEREKMFMENERIFRERSAENERIYRERSAENDRKLQEMSAETDRRFKATEQLVNQVSRQIGQLGSRWGEFVEGLIAPACETLFAERGIPVHKVSQRVTAKLSGNRHTEIDLLVVNSNAVVLVEVKSKLKVEDVKEHLIRVAEFKNFFPEYADKRIMGAVAGIVIEENVDQFAMKKGMFVIVQSGSTVRIANEVNFIPQTW